MRTVASLSTALPAWPPPRRATPRTTYSTCKVKMQRSAHRCPTSAVGRRSPSTRPRRPCGPATVRCLFPQSLFAQRCLLNRVRPAHLSAGLHFAKAELTWLLRLGTHPSPSRLRAAVPNSEVSHSTFFTRCAACLRARNNAPCRPQFASYTMKLEFRERYECFLHSVGSSATRPWPAAVADFFLQRRLCLARSSSTISPTS